jgi:hypothetical protein
MKNFCENEVNELTRLSESEMQTIQGGGFFPGIDLGLAYVLYKWGKFAADYQASLPANLKK